MTPLPAIEHARPDGLAAASGAHQVHVQHVQPVLLGQALRGPDAVDARVVDEHGGLAEPRDDLADGRVYRGAGADVQLDAEMPLPHGVGGSAGTAGVATPERHPGALAGELARDGVADAAGRARHERNLAVEQTHAHPGRRRLPPGKAGLRHHLRSASARR